MDHLHSTTTEHRKGQHLTFEHRVLIQTRRKDGWSPNRIAKEIGCAPNTVRNEIKRGTVALYKGDILLMDDSTVNVQLVIAICDTFSNQRYIFLRNNFRGG